MTEHLPDKSAREIELKLAVRDGSASVLSALSALGAGASEHRHEVTTYFDTPDQALSRAGVSVRVRRTDGRRVQTLKADRKSGVSADRGEWEWTVEDDEPDLGLLAQTPFAGMFPDRLEPVVVTDIHRTVRVLEIEGGTVVEAAFDEGAIIAGGCRHPARELELELRAGNPGSLYRIALELHARVPLTVETQSKAARGYHLRDGSVPTAQKVQDVEFERSTSASEAFRQIVLNALGHLLVNQPAALAADAEGVHQMRVAIRRLRAALTLFQPLLEPLAASRFQDELRRVGRVFGEARDWDVFCLQMLPTALEAAGAGGWRDLLRQPAETRRDAAHRRFAEEALSPPFTALVLGLAAWVEEKTLLGGSELERPIKAVSPALLDRVARKVERRGRDIENHSDIERHGLRKSLKKLRYGIDYLQGLFPAKRVNPYLHACKRLQKSLGEINDTVAAMPLAVELTADGRPDLAPAVGALAEQLGRSRDEGLRGLSKRWKAFQAEPRFWA